MFYIVHLLINRISYWWYYQCWPLWWKPASEQAPGTFVSITRIPLPSYYKGLGTENIGNNSIWNCGENTAKINCTSLLFLTLGRLKLSMSLKRRHQDWFFPGALHNSKNIFTRFFLLVLCKNSQNMCTRNYFLLVFSKIFLKYLH